MTERFRRTNKFGARAAHSAGVSPRFEFNSVDKVVVVRLLVQKPAAVTASTTRSPPPPPGAGSAVRTHRRIGRVLAVLLIAAGCPGHVRAQADANGGVAPERAGGVYECRPGPWGDLQYTRIVIEPPEEFLASDYATPDAVRWVFPGYDDHRLAQLWDAAGLTGPQRQQLAAGTRRDPASGALVVVPPADLVLALSAPARTVIYSALSVFPENPDQQEPFRFRAANGAEWFANSGLDPATITLVKSLLYRRGASLLFSDHDLVLPRLPTREERLTLVRTLARKSTVLVQLRVTPRSDIETLSNYWGRGPHRKDVRSLLRSIAHRPEGTLIDISHLLPRFARARIFTYPAASDHAGDVNYDCHWTSLNFFNDPPDNRFADADTVTHVLETEYAPVSGPRLLGDILVFFRPDGKAIHSCVYIADEIVFSKNGSSQVMPWILMALPDVVAFYPSDPPLRVVAYRRR